MGGNRDVGKNLSCPKEGKKKEGHTNRGRASKESITLNRVLPLLLEKKRKWNQGNLIPKNPNAKKAPRSC